MSIGLRSRPAERSNCVAQSRQAEWHGRDWLKRLEPARQVMCVVPGCVVVDPPVFEDLSGFGEIAEDACTKAFDIGFPDAM